jgi:hypothetical protein
MATSWSGCSVHSVSFGCLSTWLDLPNSFHIGCTPSITARRKLLKGRMTIHALCCSSLGLGDSFFDTHYVSYRETDMPRTGRIR